MPKNLLVADGRSFACKTHLGLKKQLAIPATGKKRFVLIDEGKARKK